MPGKQQTSVVFPLLTTPCLQPSATAQTALVTGATSSIDYELADLFARDQIHLVLVARCQSQLDEIKMAFSDQRQLAPYSENEQALLLDYWQARHFTLNCTVSAVLLAPDAATHCAYA